MSLFPVTCGAVLSPCGVYRYSLWRVWDETLPLCVFVMLNPSTADDVENDATITRCQERARRLGFGGLWVVNLFALRSKDRSALRRVSDPVGPANDDAILEAARKSKVVICAWGKDGNFKGRAVEVLELLKKVGVKVTALAVNGDGTPAHPLYLDYSLEPQPYAV